MAVTISAAARNAVTWFLPSRARKRPSTLLGEGAYGRKDRVLRAGNGHRPIS